FMALAPQTIALLQSARQLVHALPADAILLLTEADLDWDAVHEQLDGCRLLVAAEDHILTNVFKSRPELTVIDIDPGPTPTQERMSLALLEAVRSDRLRQGADVVALYNGIDIGQDGHEQMDSLSIIHLGEHLERLTASDLRQLDTHVPLETLRAVVDLALEIGRGDEQSDQGHRRDGQPVVGHGARLPERRGDAAHRAAAAADDLGPLPHGRAGEQRQRPAAADAPAAGERMTLP